MKKDKNIITPKEAAEIANVSSMSIMHWCNKYRIGRKIVGRWAVDKMKLEKLLAGELKIEKKKRD